MFSHRQHVYKFRQRNLFFSEVPKVDLFDFGTKLFNFGGAFFLIIWQVTLFTMLLSTQACKWVPDRIHSSLREGIDTTRYEM